jgi:hypothetical protein
MSDRSLQESHGGEGVLVGENFDVGEPGRVIDGDMDVFPADDSADVALGVGALAGVVPALAVGDALAGAAVDPSELLDVDIEQLAWASSLVALGGLEAQPAELAHPDPGQDARHRLEGHAQALGDLRAGHPQPSESSDCLDPPPVHAIGDHARG